MTEGGMVDKNESQLAKSYVARRVLQLGLWSDNLSKVAANHQRRNLLHRS